jgi:hypothetical protein
MFGITKRTRQPIAQEGETRSRGARLFIKARNTVLIVPFVLAILFASILTLSPQTASEAAAYAPWTKCQVFYMSGVRGCQYWNPDMKMYGNGGYQQSWPNQPGRMYCHTREFNPYTRTWSAWGPQIYSHYCYIP